MTFDVIPSEVRNLRDDRRQTKVAGIARRSALLRSAPASPRRPCSLGMTISR